MSTIKEDFGVPNRLAGKSFADASKSIERAFKDRGSIYDINTKKELMSRLKDMQEFKRSQMGLNPTNQKFGGGDENIAPDTPDLFTSFLGDNQDFNPGEMFGSGEGSGWLGKNSENIIGGVGLAASVLGPMLSNRRALKSLKAPEKINAYQMNEDQYTPNLVNRQQLLRNAAEQSATQRYLIGQLGGNSAQQSALLGNLNANRLITSGNLMLQSDLADSQELARIQGLKSNIQQFNIQQKERADELNTQNMAAYNNTVAAYKQAQGANIGAIGQSLFNLMQAKKYGRSMGNAALFQGIK